MINAAYRTFLEQKIVLADQSGFQLTRPEYQLFQSDKPHQIDAIRWSLSRGRALLAFSFGLGKTRIQCEIARMVELYTQKKFLVICPLGVRHQFTEEDGPA